MGATIKESVAMEKLREYLERFGAELSAGSHDDPEKGRCAMEAVAWLAGEEHSDTPACACPVLSAYVRRLNDAMPGKQRQRLWLHLCRLIGSKSPVHEQQRATHLAMGAVTRMAPVALRVAGFDAYAKACEEATTLAEATAAANAAAANAAAAAAVWDIALGMLGEALDIGISGKPCNETAIAELLGA